MEREREVILEITSMLASNTVGSYFDISSDINNMEVNVIM